MPLILAARDDNTVETISEDDLYKYTRHRWAINESSRLEERYLKFDLQALLKAAVAACFSNGARYCTKILKCKEGMNNKAYILTMDNGTEVLAKLPNPCAGPSFYITASEVATRTFLRDALSISIPRIIARSANRSNPVGAEYIIEEKAAGEPLGNFWKSLDTLPMNDRMAIVDNILEIEKKLTFIKFAKSGCIYFREDISNSEPLQTNPPLSSQILDRFTMGPLVSNEFWSGQKAGMDLNRGPFEMPEQFIDAIARNERKFIKEYATPRMNYHCSLKKAELPHEMLSLLDRYLQLTPAMVPSQLTENVDIHSPTLWHPDLHPNNIFVDPKSKNLSHVIDWQSASSLPLFYHCHVPTAIKHHGPALTILEDLDSWPEPPQNYPSLSPDEKAYIDNAIGSEYLHKYYLSSTRVKNPRFWAVLQRAAELSIRTEPAGWVQSAWSNNETFFLRRALMKIADQWEELCLDAGPCPWVLTEDELASHEHEKETRGYVSTFLAYFRDNWGVPVDGCIEVGRFTEVQAEMERMRAHFVGSADDEEEKELAEKIWPYKM
ncbi:Altered inheritance of mitochondria protein [Lachnellula suecica]|uniref:Altered inheritance of mitochondria protein n=1 Tax=Lachnellula suecica TaxID=602035 RepID=A0A8T9BZN2_9HELO|nr:Altered inheritance of mitochondria protein [Lachnellula suecica]